MDPFIQYAKEQIKVHKWSPDVIVGRVIEQGLFDAHERVCAKTLYAYIDAGLMELNNIDYGVTFEPLVSLELCQLFRGSCATYFA